MSRLRSKFFCMAALSTVVACGEDGPAGPDATVESIEVMPQTVTFAALGEAQTLFANAKDVSGITVSGVAFAWTSSDTTVVRVTQDGRVLSTGNGTATVDVRVAPNSSVGDGSAATGAAFVTVQQVSAGLAICSSSFSFGSRARATRGAMRLPRPICSSRGSHSTPTT